MRHTLEPDVRRSVTITVAAPIVAALIASMATVLVPLDAVHAQNAPATPSGLTLARGDRQLTASWTPPSDNGSSITDYDVRYKRADQAISPWIGTYDGGIAETAETFVSDVSDGAQGNPLDLGTLSTSSSGVTLSRESVGSHSGVYKINRAVDSLKVWLNSAIASNASTGAKLTVRYASSKPGTSNLLTHGTELWNSSFVFNDPPFLDSFYSVGSIEGSTTTLSADSYVWFVTTAQATVTSATVIFSIDLISTTTNKTITGLTNDVPYFVEVRASNANGEGAWSASSGGTPSSKPTAPRDVWAHPANTRLEVSWLPPAKDFGSAVSDYDVQYRVRDTSTWTDWDASTTSTAEFVTVTGLTNGSTYEVRVRAANANGEGDWSDVVSADPGAPARPGRPRLTSGYGQITASWQAPSDHGSTITDYDVRYSSDNGRTWTEIDDSTASTATNATITGLHTDVVWYVSVRASNARGDSPWSWPSVRRTLRRSFHQACDPTQPVILNVGGSCNIDATRGDIRDFNSVEITETPTVAGEPLLLRNRERDGYINLIAINPNGGTASVVTKMDGVTLEVFQIQMPVFGIASVTAVGGGAIQTGTDFKLRVQLNNPHNLAGPPVNNSGQPMRSYVELSWQPEANFTGSDYTLNGAQSTTPRLIVGQYESTVEFTMRALAAGNFAITATAKTPETAWWCSANPSLPCYTPPTFEQYVQYRVTSADVRVLVVAESNAAGEPPTQRPAQRPVTSFAVPTSDLEQGSRHDDRAVRRDRFDSAYHKLAKSPCSHLPTEVASDARVELPEPDRPQWPRRYTDC